MRGFKFLSIFEPLLYFFFSLAFSFAAARHYKHKNTLMTLMIMDKHPARELLLKVTRDFPDIWKKINVLLEEKENIGWPDWCFLPIDAWIALADYAKGEPNAYHADSFDMGKEIALIKLANTFAALGTWRMTQGIYRFDSTLYAELISTPITGDLKRRKRASVTFLRLSPPHGMWVCVWGRHYEVQTTKVKARMFRARGWVKR